MTSTTTTSISPEVRIEFHDHHTDVSIDTLGFVDVANNPRYERGIARLFDLARLRRAPTAIQIEEIGLDDWEHIGVQSYSKLIKKSKAKWLARELEAFARSFKN